jgi:hypothetical protein
VSGYVMSNNEYRRQEQTRRFFRLLDAQDKEVTPTMLRFDAQDDAEYHIRIVDESHGFLTCLIRLRKSGTPLYRIRFQKKPKQGVVYNFAKADRLWRLYVEEAIFPDLLLPLEV